MHTQKMANYTLPFQPDKPLQSAPLLSQKRWVFSQGEWLYFMFPSGQHGGGGSLRTSLYLAQHPSLVSLTEGVIEKDKNKNLMFPRWHGSHLIELGRIMKKRNKCFLTIFLTLLASEIPLPIII